MARGKGEGSIFKNGAGLWEIRVELPRSTDGKRRRKVVRRTNRADAVRELRKLKAELSTSGDLATSSATLDDWSARWLEQCAAKLAPNTVSGYRTAFRDYINPLLGKRRLDKITPQDVKHLHAAVMATPKDKALRALSDPPEGTELLSSTYARLVHNTLSGALKAAVREGLVSRNVAEQVDKPAARHTDEKTLTLDESVQLLRHLASDPDGAIWITYLLTAARRGEVIGLEVDRVLHDAIDLSWQTQRIANIDAAPVDYEYRHLEGNLYLVRPKSKAGWRRPPMVAELRELLRRQIGDRTEGLVFLRDGRAWDPADASKEWKNVLRAAGVSDDVKLHGARHTSIGLLYELGVGEATIMEIAGHSTVSVTRRYGTAGNRRAMQDAAKKLSAALTGKALDA